MTVKVKGRPCGAPRRSLRRASLRRRGRGRTTSQLRTVPSPPPSLPTPPPISLPSNLTGRPIRSWAVLSRRAAIPPLTPRTRSPPLCPSRRYRTRPRPSRRRSRSRGIRSRGLAGKTGRTPTGEKTRMNIGRSGVRSPSTTTTRDSETAAPPRRGVQRFRRRRCLRKTHSRGSTAREGQTIPFFILRKNYRVTSICTLIVYDLFVIIIVKYIPTHIRWNLSLTVHTTRLRRKLSRELYRMKYR